MRVTIERLNTVPTTQYCARLLAERSAPEGVVLVARSQESGRGRMGRRWVSPEGGLWFTMILRPTGRPADVSELAVVAAGSVAGVIAETTGLAPEVKAPNDILIDGDKVCGILADMVVEGEAIKYVLLGVGINANAAPRDLPDDPAYTAASLQDKTGQTIDVNKLLTLCVHAIIRDYEKLI
jgi:BirA family transcriptional regulator, biotin operon repressor / biotin---[acetyl-CoA-carboxylase] ligase